MVLHDHDPDGYRAVHLEPLVQAHNCPLPQRSNLDQIAHVVGEPQASSAGRSGGRSSAADHRVVDTAVVAEFANHRPVISPQSELATASTVLDAVARNLVSSGDELIFAFCLEAGLGRKSRYRGAHGGEVSRPERETAAPQWWRRQRHKERFR